MNSEFQFDGTIPSSKSILNRLLIIQSYESKLKIVGTSDADDVTKMRSALQDLAGGKPADCGEAGTTLRFLALRASRIPGRHVLKGGTRLFARPQNELINLLNQLGVRAELGSDRLVIEGAGWRIPEKFELVIDRSISSQFTSAVILNAWKLEEDLKIRCAGDPVSESYLEMTLSLANRCGLQWQRNSDGSISIARDQQPMVQTLTAEPDASSAFAIAALAAIKGRARFRDWPETRLQADAVFAEILAKMGCGISYDPIQKILTVEKADPKLRAIEMNLKNAPDLFPVLSALAAFAEGRTRLHGAPHLVHKESNRIARVAELINSIGARALPKADGIEIEGIGKQVRARERSIEFDADHDHRLVMAAAVAQAAGCRIEIKGAECVRKSFPEFLAIWPEAVGAGNAWSEL